MTKQIIKTLEVFITQFKGQKKESLETKMLDALTRLLHKKDFVSRIDVDILTSEDIDINLYDKYDKIIDKSGIIGLFFYSNRQSPHILVLMFSYFSHLFSLLNIYLYFCRLLLN